MDKHQRHNALKYELVKEQAGALGLAGKKLQKALDAYRAHASHGSAPSQKRSQLFEEVVNRAYALLLQREIIGFSHGNVDWLRSSFEFPDGVLKRLGFE